MKSKKLIFLVVPALLVLAGCDSILVSDNNDNKAIQFKNVRKSDFENLKGHWVHNPGRCKEVIQLNGLVDIKLTDKGLAVGGSQTPLHGTLTLKALTPDVLDQFSSVKTCTGKPVKIEKSSKVIEFKSKHYAQSFVLTDKNVWLIHDDKIPRILEKFTAVDFKNLPVQEPTQEEFITP